jgi:pimeloyl-ACP methyl ester carboxylesterase
MYSKASVRSADGTTIGYRHYGTDGPGLIVLHGGMKAGQHFGPLAADLAQQSRADRFQVYLPDRRGRGLSGPHGDAYGMEREVEDVRALAEATGARYLFGHSAGALVALRAAAGFERVALYEPPLSVNGSAPTDWLPRFDREIAAGRRISAVVTALKGMRTEPTFGRLPRWLLLAGGAIGLRAERPGVDAVRIADLVPTIHYDIGLVHELAGTADEFAALRVPVLLLGGSKSPDYLDVALQALAATLPCAERVTLDGLGHDGPEDDGDPARVAHLLREFFSLVGSSDVDHQAGQH